MLRFVLLKGDHVIIDPISVMSIEEDIYLDKQIARVLLSNGKVYEIEDPNRIVARTIEQAKEK